MRQAGRVAFTCIAVVGALLAVARAEAQSPGLGYVPSVCPAQLPLTNLSADLSNGERYYWIVNLRLQYYVGGVQSRGKYYVWPQNDWIPSVTVDRWGKTAEWWGGASDMTCWQRRIRLPSGNIITEYLNVGAGNLEGDFRVPQEEEEMCDEEGNIVDYDGTPCPSGSTPLTGEGSGGSQTSGNCTQEYVYVDYWYEDRGWVQVWEGWATVCT